MKIQSSVLPSVAKESADASDDVTDCTGAGAAATRDERRRGHGADRAAAETGRGTGESTLTKPTSPRTDEGTQRLPWRGEDRGGGIVLLAIIAASFLSGPAHISADAAGTAVRAPRSGYAAAIMRPFAARQYLSARCCDPCRPASLRIFVFAANVWLQTSRQPSRHRLPQVQHRASGMLLDKWRSSATAPAAARRSP